MILCDYCAELIDDTLSMGGAYPLPSPSNQVSTMLNIGGQRVDLHPECVIPFATEAKKIKGIRKPK